jgi:hypothetical protein
MAQAVSRRPFATEERIRSLVNPCEIDGGQNGTGIGFSPSTSAYSTNGPHSSSSRCCSYRKDKRAKSGNLRKVGFFFGNRVSLVRKVLSLLTFCCKVIAMVAFVNRAVFKVCKSVHHHTIQINQPTRCNNFSSLLLDIYLQLNMFRASSRPSLGAQQLQ